MNGDELIEETFVRRQPDGCLVPLQGTVTAMLVTMALGMDRRAVDHYIVLSRRGCRKIRRIGCCCLKPERPAVLTARRSRQHGRR